MLGRVPHSSGVSHTAGGVRGTGCKPSTPRRRHTSGQGSPRGSCESQTPTRATAVEGVPSRVPHAATFHVDQRSLVLRQHIVMSVTRSAGLFWRVCMMHTFDCLRECGTSPTDHQIQPLRAAAACSALCLSSSAFLLHGTTSVQGTQDPTHSLLNPGPRYRGRLLLPQSLAVNWFDIHDCNPAVCSHPRVAAEVRSTVSHAARL